jgi:hypothetical protein
MAGQIFSLTIQLRKSFAANDSIDLNKTFIRALLVNLKCVYREVLVWSTPTRIGVWVFGDDTDHLIHCFAGFQDSTSHMKVLAGDEAKEWFYDVTSGKKWREYNPLVKYNDLCLAETLAMISDAVGEHLNPLISKGKQQLLLQPVVYGGKHSWLSSVNCNDSQENIVNIVYPDLFYRFSIN